MQSQTAPTAAFGRVALEQVVIDPQARSGAVGQTRCHIDIEQRGLADIAVGRRARHRHAATPGRDRRVAALVEQERVVLDHAVVNEPIVGKASTVARAQVAAHPVVGEVIEVGAGAERDTAGRRGRGRVDLVTVSRVERD